MAHKSETEWDQLFLGAKRQDDPYLPRTSNAPTPAQRERSFVASSSFEHRPKKCPRPTTKGRGNVLGQDLGFNSDNMKLDGDREQLSLASSGLAACTLDWRPY